MNDSEFDSLLRATRDDTPLPPLFSQEVWQRIYNAEAECPPEIIKFPSMLNALARPWSAVAGIAAMVMAGLWLGAVTVPEAKDAKLAYAESISPFAHEK
jgi:hypothetical protein